MIKNLAWFSELIRVCDLEDYEFEETEMSYNPAYFFFQLRACGERNDFTLLKMFNTVMDEAFIKDVLNYLEEARPVEMITAGRLTMKGALNEIIQILPAYVIRFDSAADSNSLYQYINKKVANADINYGDRNIIYLGKSFKERPLIERFPLCSFFNPEIIAQNTMILNQISGGFDSTIKFGTHVDICEDMKAEFLRKLQLFTHNVIEDMQVQYDQSNMAQSANLETQQINNQASSTGMAINQEPDSNNKSGSFQIGTNEAAINILPYKNNLEVNSDQPELQKGLDIDRQVYNLKHGAKLQHENPSNAHLLNLHPNLNTDKPSFETVFKHALSEKSDIQMSDPVLPENMNQLQNNI